MTQRSGTALAMTMPVLLSTPRAFAQPPAARPPSGRGGPQAPQYVSPEVGADRRITFRIFAPNAETRRLTGSDIPGVGQGTLLRKGEGDVWLNWRDYLIEFVTQLFKQRTGTCEEQGRAQALRCDVSSRSPSRLPHATAA